MSKSNSPKNRETLADVVVESWDQKTLSGFAIHHLMELYVQDADVFREDWESMFGVEDEEDQEDQEEQNDS